MTRMPQSVDSTQAIAESDAVAVERTLAGDRDAYRVLVERHSHSVFRLAYGMTRNRHDAEEVVQEAFCAGIKNSVSLQRERISGRGFIALLRTMRLTACASDRRKNRGGKRREWKIRTEWKTIP